MHITGGQLTKVTEGHFCKSEDLAISISVRCMLLVLGSGASPMVVEDVGECCGGETSNFKIDGGVRVHVEYIVDHHHHLVFLHLFSLRYLGTSECMLGPIDLLVLLLRPVSIFFS